MSGIVIYADSDRDFIGKAEQKLDFKGDFKLLTATSFDQVRELIAKNECVCLITECELEGERLETITDLMQKTLR